MGRSKSPRLYALLGAACLVSACAGTQDYTTDMSYTSLQSPQTPLNTAPIGSTQAWNAQDGTPQGQWVNTAQAGWIWVPANANTYAVDNVPYTYLYTPAYGWTWYASPWGWGPFAMGAWVGGPWAYGYQAWYRGAGGWGWYGNHGARVGGYGGGHFHGGGRSYGGGGHGGFGYGGHGGGWGGHGGGGYHGGGGHGGGFGGGHGGGHR